MRALILAAFALAGCGYQPPSQADAAAPAYSSDLAACHQTARDGVDKQNAKTGLAWLASPVRRWGQIGDATQSCMAGKGYGSVRWCTADELKTGAHTGDIVVTSSGIHCVDQPATDRRRPAT